METKKKIWNIFDEEVHKLLWAIFGGFIGAFIAIFISFNLEKKLLFFLEIFIFCLIVLFSAIIHKLVGELK